MHAECRRRDRRAESRARRPAPPSRACTCRNWNCAFAAPAWTIREREQRRRRREASNLQISTSQCSLRMWIHSVSSVSVTSCRALSMLPSWREKVTGPERSPRLVGSGAGAGTQEAEAVVQQSRYRAWARRRWRPRGRARAERSAADAPCGTRAARSTATRRPRSRAQSVRVCVDKRERERCKLI